MGVELRSDKKKIMNKLEVTRLINELLLPLKERVESQNKLVIEQHLEIVNINEKLQKLDGKICESEHQIRYLQNMQGLMARKIEAQNQYSRRNNLRVKGVPLLQNESPVSLLKIIQGECRKLKLGLQDLEFERAHRIGKKYIVDGRWYQAVIVKMISWGARNKMYEARGKSQYKWSADLTNERSSLLNFARNEATDPIDFVFVDRNCQLMVRSTSGKFYSFSSEIEFMTLVTWIENHSDVEERYELKYCEYLESVLADNADDGYENEIPSVPASVATSNEVVEIFEVNSPTIEGEGASDTQDPPDTLR